MNSNSIDGENWLRSLSDHTAFSSSSTNSRSKENDRTSNFLSNHHPNSRSSTNAPSSSSKSSPQPNVISIVNQTDLVICCDQEIRLVSLSKFKRSLSDRNPPTTPSDVGSGHHNHQDHSSYKVLRPVPSSAIPNGPVNQLVPNPTSRLLAICSSTQVSVISLPRPEEETDPKPQIDCSALRIGGDGYGDEGGDEDGSEKTFNGLSSLVEEPQVMKVLWHEWSYRASTILILYSTGIVHEYDVSRDSQNPTQVIDFNSVYGFIEPSSQELQEHSSQPATEAADETGVWRRMKELSSSSIVQKASIPRSRQSSNQMRMLTPQPKSRIGTPQSGMGVQAKTYGSPDVRSTTAVSMCFGMGSSDWGPLTLYGLMKNGDVYAICPYLPKNSFIPPSYRNSLLRFLTAKSDSISRSSKAAAIQENSHFQSLEYLNVLFKLPADSDFDPEVDETDERAEGRKNLMVEIVKSFKFRPIRQGPYLMQPSPIELDEEEEDEASDLIYLRYPSHFSEFGNSASEVGMRMPDDFPEYDHSSLSIFLIAYNRKVDVCLEFQKVEPIWLSVEHDEESLRGMVELPILGTYESIDLGVPTNSSSDLNKPNRSCPLGLLKDPRYSDTIYLHHRWGLHAISTLGWIKRFLSALESNPGTDLDESGLMRKALDEFPASEVVWVARIAEKKNFQPQDPSGRTCRIRGFCVLDDAYLGYGLLMVTDDLQVITQQLRLRPSPLPASNDPIQDLSNLKITNESNQPSSSLSSYKESSLAKTVGFKTPIRPEQQVSFYASLLSEKTSKPNQQQQLFTTKKSENVKNIKKPSDITQVNSSTVRYAVEVSNEIDRRVRDLIESMNEAQDRLKLQLEEFKRQLDHVFKAKDNILSSNNGSSNNNRSSSLVLGSSPSLILGSSSSSLRNPGSTIKSNSERISRIEKNQGLILKRADIILQRLSDESNLNELSKEESKWFSELKRMRNEILVGGSLLEDTNNNNNNDNTNRELKGLKHQVEDLRKKVDFTKESIDRIRAQQRQQQKKEEEERLKMKFNSSSSLVYSIKDNDRYRGSFYPIEKFGESQILNVKQKLVQSTSCLGLIMDQINKLNHSISNT